MNTKLLEILKPPERSLEVPTVKQWADFESQWHRVPADFKRFIATYGTGTIGEFIELWNPASRNEYMNLSEKISTTLSTFREWPRPGLKLFPEPGGSLPFGNTGNGDILAWEVDGDPEKWRIVVIDSRSSETETFDMCLTEWLIALLRRQITCKIFPSFPGSIPMFVQ